MDPSVPKFTFDLFFLAPTPSVATGSCNIRQLLPTVFENSLWEQAVCADLPVKSSEDKPYEEDLQAPARQAKKWPFSETNAFQELQTSSTPRGH